MAASAPGLRARRPPRELSYHFPAYASAASLEEP